MRYFRIRHSLDRKVLGHDSQVKEVKHNCNVWDEPKFIDRIRFTKVDFTPIVSNPVLYAKSKRTDLIKWVGVGFGLKLLISGKLKMILEQYGKQVFQRFQCSVFHKGIEYKDYWIMNAFEVNNEFIDYSKSDVFLIKQPRRKVRELNVENYSDFQREMKQVKEMGYPFNVSIKRFSLSENIEKDFFLLRRIEGGVGYFVSERLKQEIEQAGCTGIEFQPAHLSYNEWVARGGERDKVYGKP